MPNRNRNPRRRSFPQTGPRRVYYDKNLGQDGSRVARRPSPAHADLVSAAVLTGTIDMQRLAWEAEVGETIRQNETGLAVGRLVTSEKFLDDIGRLARRLRRQSIGAVALVPFGVRCTDTRLAIGTQISDVNIGSIGFGQFRFEDEIEANFSKPSKIDHMDTAWVGMFVTDGGKGTSKYLAHEAKLAINTVGYSGRKLRTPVSFAALFGFQSSDAEGINYTLQGLEHINRRVTLGPLTTLPDAMLNLDPDIR